MQNNNEKSSNEMDEFLKLLKENERRKKEAPAMEHAMRHSFIFINNLGMEFINPEKVPYTVEKKIIILKNMINWFSMEPREEYEVCAELKPLLDELIRIDNL